MKSLNGKMKIFLITLLIGLTNGDVYIDYCVGLTTFTNTSREILQSQNNINESVQKWGVYLDQHITYSTNNVTVKVSEIINTGIDNVTNNITNEVDSKFKLVQTNVNENVDKKAEDIRNLAKQLNKNTIENIDSKFAILASKMEGVESNSDNLLLRIQTKLDNINLPSFSHEITDECSRSSTAHKNEITEDIKVLSLAVSALADTVNRLDGNIKTLSSDVERKFREITTAIQEIKGKN